MAKAFGATAARAIRTASGKADSRSKMIGAVRMAAKRVGMNDDDRRALQQELTGKISLGDMSLAEIGQVLDRLNKDWKGPMGHRAHAGKIRALWWTLYWLGAIEDPADRPLDAFVKRQAGVSSLRFLDSRKAHSVIEALKAWAAREGVSWPGPERLAEVTVTQPGVDAGKLDRHAVLAAIGVKLRDVGALNSSHLSYCEKALGLGCNHWSWTPHELDAAIKLLGKRLRHVTGRKDAAR
jgi:phage gp16-like protein